MRKFLKKFFAEVSEWFADVVDHYKLWVAKNKIIDLNEELDWAANAWERHQTEVLLEMYSKSQNRISRRIRWRERRHNHRLQLVVH